MGVKIAIEGELPRDFGLARPKLKEAAACFAARSAARARQIFREVTVILQNDAESDEVHRGILGVEGATDVITQRYDALPPEPPGVYGELYVNVERARQAAPKHRGWSPAKELLLYIAHGMDHLSGADDQSPADYARMRRRELGWLKGLALGVAALFLALGPFAAQAQEEEDWERAYGSVGGTLVLPQGGVDMRRLGGAAFRLGYYVDDFLAVEACAAALENVAGLGLQGLWHWWGYEKADPFFTFGATGWIDGTVGPTGGIGLFYHLDDWWSVRFDAQATLGLDSSPGMVYALSAGVQYAF